MYHIFQALMLMDNYRYKISLIDNINVLKYIFNYLLATTKKKNKKKKKKKKAENKTY